MHLVAPLLMHCICSLLGRASTPGSRSPTSSSRKGIARASPLSTCFSRRRPSVRPLRLSSAILARAEAHLARSHHPRHLGLAPRLLRRLPRHPQGEAGRRRLVRSPSFLSRGPESMLTAILSGSIIDTFLSKGKDRTMKEHRRLERRITIGTTLALFLLWVRPPSLSLACS